MKISIVHDWLVTLAGAEKALESIYEIYANADIYTLLHDRNNLKSTIFENANITSSFIERLPKATKNYRNYLPLFPLAIEQFDLSEYDVVISSSHCAAKNVLTTDEQIHICYCYTPVRYAWDMYHEYLKDSNLDNNSIKSILARIILHYIRLWDYSSKNRVDHYIAISNFIAQRIKKVYNREAKVIYPPVNVDNFELYTQKEDFYLTASRMVPYKKIDLVVEAFNEMPDKKLVVIGDGPEYEKIKSKAGKNIQIMGYQNFDVLKDHMKRAKAFIFAPKEDFGIIPVEAQSCGTPVIAYGVGGSLETVVDEQTGLFFKNQDIKSIVDTIKTFELKDFDYQVIRKHAEKFSKNNFKSQFQNHINQIILEKK